MHSFPKKLFAICAGVLCLASTQVALADKEWQDEAPMIQVQSIDDDLKFNVAVSFEMVNRDNTSYHRTSSSLVIPGDKASLFFNTVQIEEGTTLSFSQLSILDESGTVLPNCNMLENDAFVAGAKAINIVVTSAGCNVS